MKKTNTENILNTNITESKAKQMSTWTDWYNTSYDYVYPYFTSDYYYVGQIVVVAGVVVTCYYVAPAVASYMYGSPNNTPSNPPAPSNGAAGKASSVAQTTADTATQATQPIADAITPQAGVPTTAVTDAFAQKGVEQIIENLLDLKSSRPYMFNDLILENIKLNIDSLKTYEVALLNMCSYNVIGTDAKKKVLEHLIKIKETKLIEELATSAELEELEKSAELENIIFMMDYLIGLLSL